MDFNIRVFHEIQVSDTITFLITETTVSTWIIMGLMLLFGIVVRVKSAKWYADPMAKPSGLQNFVELCVDTFDGFFKSNAGDKVHKLAPWFFTLFAFLLVANLIGATGLRPPTADWGMTFPLALSSFFLIQYAGIRHRPKAYLKSLCEPIFIFLPLNIMGELSRPISLSFRLFGNVLGGLILLSLLYGLAPFVLRIALPIPLHMYFDLAAGALQAFIFTVLSLTFIGIAAGKSEEA